MSEYPTAAFPCHTRRYNREDQRNFVDYGCWESVDVDTSSEEPVVLVKKHRPTHVEEDTFSQFLPNLQRATSVDGRVLSPEHDFLMLGKPLPIERIINEDIHFDDIYSYQIMAENKQSLNNNNRHLVTRAIDHYRALCNDHPDIMYGSLLSLIFQLQKQHSEKKSPSYECRDVFRRPRSDHLYLHLDLHLCDVNRMMLKDDILDSMQSQAIDLYGNRQFSGGCLSYNSLGKSTSKQYGFFACPQGEGMDELSLKLLTMDCGERPNGDCGSSESFSYPEKHNPLIPTLDSGSDHRQTLNGRILQNDVVSTENPGNYIIATRSDYHILLNVFNGDYTDWNEEENSAVYTSDSAVTTVDVLGTSANSRITSVALNPYISGECAFATEDGLVQLWSPNISRNHCQEDSSSNLETLMSGTMGGLHSSIPWRQVSYGAHPRQLYIADSGNVCVFDLRTQNDSVSLLNISLSKLTKPNELIYGISSGRKMGNEYECLVVTDNNMFLMDQRHCGKPLVQWATRMPCPPLYICPVPVCTSSTMQSEFSSSSWSYNTMSILLGNQCSHDVYMYQFCRTRSQSEENYEKVFPPQCVGAPRTLGSFKDLSRYCKARSIQNTEYLQTRLAKMTVGLEAVSVSDLLKNGRDAVIVFQMNSVGDIGYQTLSMRNSREVYDTCNIVTGKTRASFLTSDEEKTRERIENLKEENYSQWLKDVCITGQFDGQVSTRGHRIRDHDKIFIKKDAIMKGLNRTVEETKPLRSCQLCVSTEIHCEGEEDEPGPSTICDHCGMDINQSSTIIDWMKNPNCHQSLLNSASMQHTMNGQGETRDAQLNNLKLINLSESPGQDEGDELGRLLKGTWSGTYQEYWEKLRKEEASEKLEEARKENRQRLDFNDNRVNQTENGTQRNSDSLKKTKRKTNGRSSLDKGDKTRTPERPIRHSASTRKEDNNRTSISPSIPSLLSRRPKPSSLHSSSQPQSSSKHHGADIHQNNLNSSQPVPGSSGSFLSTPRTFSFFSPNRNENPLKSGSSPQGTNGSSVSPSRPFSFFSPRREGYSPSSNARRDFSPQKGKRLFNINSRTKGSSLLRNTSQNKKQKQSASKSFGF